MYSCLQRDGDSAHRVCGGGSLNTARQLPVTPEESGRRVSAISPDEIRQLEDRISQRILQTVKVYAREEAAFITNPLLLELNSLQSRVLDFATQKELVEFSRATHQQVNDLREQIETMRNDMSHVRGLAEAGNVKVATPDDHAVKSKNEAQNVLDLLETMRKDIQEMHVRLDETPLRIIDIDTHHDKVQNDATIKTDKKDVVGETKKAEVLCVPSEDSHCGNCSSAFWNTEPIGATREHNRYEELLTRIDALETSKIKGNVESPSKANSAKRNEVIGIEPAWPGTPTSNKESIETVTTEASWSGFDQGFVYEFGESVWDIFFIVGARTRWEDYIIVVGVCIVNLILQITFTSLTYFTMAEADAIDDDSLRGYSMWRMVSGHSYNYFDAFTNTSLATRVCDEDPTNVVSGFQMTDLGVFRLYIQNNVGHIMCLLCLTVWLLNVFKEFVAVKAYVHAIISLPISSGKSVITYARGSIHVKELSVLRVIVMVIAVIVPRLLVAVWLGYSGCLYLAFTKGVSDLLLNALALGFVLELDEFLCGILVPRRIRRQLLETEAIPLTSGSRMPLVSRVDIESLFTWIAGTSALIVINYVVVKPEIREMETAISYMCHGDTNFIYSLNSAFGALVTAKTVQFAAGYEHTHENYSFRAVLQRTNLMQSLCEREGIHPLKKMCTRVPVPLTGLVGNWLGFAQNEHSTISFARVNSTSLDYTWTLFSQWDTSTQINKGIVHMCTSPSFSQGYCDSRIELSLDKDNHVWIAFVTYSIREKYSFARQGVLFTSASTAEVLRLATLTVSDSIEVTSCQDVASSGYIEPMRAQLGLSAESSCLDLKHRCNEKVVRMFCPSTCQCYQSLPGGLQSGFANWGGNFDRSGCGSRCTASLQVLVRNWLETYDRVSCADQFYDYAKILASQSSQAGLTLESAYDTFFEQMEQTFVERGWLNPTAQPHMYTWGSNLFGTPVSTAVYFSSQCVYQTPSTDISFRHLSTQMLRQRENTCLFLQVVLSFLDVDLCPLSNDMASLQMLCPQSCGLCSGTSAQAVRVSWDDLYNATRDYGILEERPFSISLDFPKNTTTINRILELAHDNIWNGYLDRYGSLQVQYSQHATKERLCEVRKDLVEFAQNNPDVTLPFACPWPDCA